MKSLTQKNKAHKKQIEDAYRYANSVPSKITRDLHTLKQLAETYQQQSTLIAIEETLKLRLKAQYASSDQGVMLFLWNTRYLFVLIPNLMVLMTLLDLSDPVILSWSYRLTTMSLVSLALIPVNGFFKAFCLWRTGIISKRIEAILIESSYIKQAAELACRDLPLISQK